MRVRNSRPWALLGCVLIAAVGDGETVIRVTDGDSLVIDSNGREVEVRLADIDAPEFDQPRGNEARVALHSLVAGRDVRLDLIGGDAYRRIVARVYVDETDVSAELVRRGLAWVRRAYEHAPELTEFEDRARRAARGLWADDNRVAPWIWRASRPLTGDRLRRTIPKVDCGTKRVCSHMTTCEEAIAFLRQCKLTQIDGDGDGTPCEKLCR